VKTNFQQISVWDVITPARGSVDAFEQSLTGGGSYSSSHPELFAPDRMVFLDGLLQSRRVGDAAYHEALVHPALFAHPNPKRVAIIGGGEGATLREVLKHNTIEEVVMIEIDEMMVSTSRTYLPEWSDCSNIQGRAANCFDDRRTRLHCEDAFQWFKERFVQNLTGYSEELFDVIIMDAL
jgi:spermidine synthase